jgi:acetyl-CoA C-acetyltransferase
VEAPLIVSACRTPIGKFGKSLVGVPAAKLGEVTVRESLSRAGLRPEDVEEVIFGNVISAGLGQNVARQVAVYSDIPYGVGSFSVNKVCGSGLKSVILAAQAIKAGDRRVVVVGGTENMSNAPYLARQQRWGSRYGETKLEDSMIVDGLWDKYNDFHMGITGERIAKKHGVTRGQADAYAYESHMRAARAQESGRFEEEIVPVELTYQGRAQRFTRDECIRKDTNPESLAKLKPAFLPDGILTAGNSSQLSDGASALVVASEQEVEESGLKPLASILGYETGGTRPEDVMEAPIETVRALLTRMGISMEEIDLVEYNEAYSTSSIVVRQELKVPEDRFNVNGGAIALGHPLGCSGARILTTLLFELKKRGKKFGLATLCMGGGNALAMLVKSV